MFQAAGNKLAQCHVKFISGAMHVAFRPSAIEIVAVHFEIDTEAPFDAVADLSILRSP